MHGNDQKLEEMRHPLLIDVVDEVVANDFEIGKDCHSIVITGSNTGGKTVTIKTVGLFVLMTKAGLFLPCAMAKIYPFNKVFADIGDAQSIQQSLSTFSSHMTNIIGLLNKADEKSFVILDEICAGTDPTEGALLAKTIFVENKTRINTNKNFFIKDSPIYVLMIQILPTKTFRIFSNFHSREAHYSAKSLKYAEILSYL